MLYHIIYFFRGHNFANVGEEYDGGQVYSGANSDKIPQNSADLKWEAWLTGIFAHFCIFLIFYMKILKIYKLRRVVLCSKITRGSISPLALIL